VFPEEHFLFTLFRHFCCSCDVSFSHDAQRHRQIDRQTDRQTYDA